MHNGDLNGDGYNGNDPIYIPTDATDPGEILFVDDGSTTAAEQAQAFEEFIERYECLDEQRGNIMEPNSCRTPWTNRIDISLRQSLPDFRGHRVQLQIDVFNFGNLVGRTFGEDDWGQSLNPVLSPTFPDQRLLSVEGRTAGPLSTSQATFNFANDVMTQGAFEREQSVSGNFYQAQVTLRYTF